MSFFSNIMSQVPDNRARSATAVQNVADERDDLIYSAIALGDGGLGVKNMFTQPVGGAIPFISAGALVPDNDYQSVYTKATTNLAQAGQLGSIIGDVAIYSIGLDLEMARFHPFDGSISSEGSTEFEQADVAAKVAWTLKVGGNKEYSTGPVRSFPSLGSVYGSISVSNDGGGTPSTASLSNFGSGGRRIGAPIPCQRTDTIQGETTVVEALVFRGGGDPVSNNPTLLSALCKAAVSSDPR
jgi:hypothetical protein